MKRFPVLISVWSVAVAGFFPLLVSRATATDFAWELRCEQQYSTAELPDLIWSQGSMPLIEARVCKRGKAVAPDDGVSVEMMIAPTPTSQWWAVVTNQATNSTGYLIQWPTVGTNTTGTAPWYYTVYFYKDGHRYWTGSGDLWIEGTTATGDGLIWQEIVSGDISWVSNRFAEAESAIATNAAAIAEVRERAADAWDLATTNAAAIDELSVATNAFRLSAAMEPQTLRMDLFEVAFDPRLAATGDSTGAVVQAHSIQAAPVITSNYMGYLLTPTIYASTSETNAIRYSRQAASSTLATNALAEVFWSPSATNSVLQATFGTVSRIYSGFPPLDGTATATNWIYAGDATGSLRKVVDTLALSVDTNKSRDYWTAATPQGALNPNFFFGSSWDFRCMSRANDRHGVSRTVTLVTPRHGVCAAHFAPEVGSTCYFGDYPNGATVDAVRKFSGDRCVVRFSAPVAGITPACLIDGDSAWRNNLTLPENVAGVPGLYALAFHAGGRGQIVRVPTALGATSLELRPATNALPASVAGVDFVGGDSGHPAFLLPTLTRTPILLSCNWVTYGAGNGGGGSSWTSPESWALLRTAVADWGDTDEPVRYDLAPWPDYVTPPLPQ